jgi:hypothetical protein
MYKKTGKLIYKKVDSGTSKAGKTWQKMTFVIDMTTDPKYPKKVAFDTFKGNVMEFVQDTMDGTMLSVEFDVESREWEGRWFSNVNAVGVEVVRNEQPEDYHKGVEQLAQMHNQQYQRATNVPDGGDDLPF